jgi:GAF domain-containing protein
MDGEDVIGAVDLQSGLRNDFRDEDIQALKTIGNLMGAALRNARLFDQQEKTVAEQQRLYLESESNLREIRRLNRQLTRIGWDDYIAQSAEVAGVTLRNNDEIIPNMEWNENMIAATATGEAIIHSAYGKPGVLAVPVRLRGEIIGAIEVETGTDFSEQDALDMVEAVAQRLATSLDNARLFEEAQAATIQEQRVNTIVARYQSAQSVDDLLQVTLKELGEALGAQRAAIRLGIIADENVNGGVAQ